jgi:hypothetical protein
MIANEQTFPYKTPAGGLQGQAVLEACTTGYAPSIATPWVHASREGEASVYDFLIALAFVFMVVIPVVVATCQHPDADEDA